MLNREEILSKEDLPKEEVEVPEWGGSVFIRGMNGKERDEIETLFMAAQKKDSLKGIRAYLICMVTMDENGNHLFEKKDAEALSEKSGLALDRLFNVALKLSGMSPDSLERAEKN